LRARHALNVITLPANWANYGTIMKDFTAKYGIKINDANPDGSSQDELNAVNQLKGQDRAPDVLDAGTAFAVKGAQQGILAPYKVASWGSIPADAKASDGTWFADYGGYVAIGYNTDKVKTPPTSFADLLKPEYKNQVAINGNPTQASAAFSAVFASALANGGSLDNITPGVAYFKKLHSVGNFVPVTASAVTEPVRLHVAAKRYLCATEPGYFGLLSAESVRVQSPAGPVRPWRRERLRPPAR
jgi:putative spermidine/putrescine transport system substrate-binding protein